LPSPAVWLASMNRMSPPTGVHASPVATPARLVRRATSLSNLLAPRIPTRSSAPTFVGADLQRRDAALGDAYRRPPADRGDLPLERAHAGLARVVADDRRKRTVADRKLPLLQAVVHDLAGEQIAPGNLELLLVRIAGQFDDFHAVAQRPGNVVDKARECCRERLPS